LLARRRERIEISKLVHRLLEFLRRLVLVLLRLGKLAGALLGVLLLLLFRSAGIGLVVLRGVQVLRRFLEGAFGRLLKLLARLIDLRLKGLITDLVLLKLLEGIGELASD